MSDPLASNVKGGADGIFGTIANPVLPDFALRYAPLLWLSSQETYWPGDPLLHLKNVIPKTGTGTVIDVPPQVAGTYQMLNVDAVNQYDTWLSLDVSITTSVLLLVFPISDVFGG